MPTPEIAKAHLDSVKIQCPKCQTPIELDGNYFIRNFNSGYDPECDGSFCDFVDHCSTCGGEYKIDFYDKEIVG